MRSRRGRFPVTLRYRRAMTDDSSEIGSSKGAGRVLRLVRPYPGRVVLATLFLIAGSAIGLVYPKAIEFAVDELGETGSIDAFNMVAMGLSALFVVQAVMTWCRHYLMSWLGERAVADLRDSVFLSLISQPPGWFHGRRSGELVGRISGDVTTLQSFVGSELSIGLRNLIQFLGGVAFLFITDVELTLAMLVIVPPVILSVMVFGRYIRKLSRRLQDEVAKTNGRVQEVLGAIMTVQAFGQQARESKEYKADVESAFEAALSLARFRASFMSTSGFAGYAALAIVVWLGGQRVAEGDLSPGALLAFVLYTTLVAVALASLSNTYAAFQRAAGATERLYGFLETTPAIRSKSDAERLAPGVPSIRFDNVSFAYESRTKEPVFEGVNLEIDKGQTVAFVGTSGAGKSTIVSLVPRFYDVSAGRVLVGGVDVRELELESLRGRLALVPQDPVLFSGSIADNIRYGAPEASMSEVIDAAKRANVDQFVREFPDGYDTLCGERGVEVSGGQRQRIAIARALLSNPDVLILDEATSNLDSESEALIQSALDSAKEGRTTLIVAHRLSTIRDADLIVVMDGGGIAEMGTHEMLLEKNGVYRKLVDRQV